MSNGRAFHHHGTADSIATNDGGGERKSERTSTRRPTICSAPSSFGGIEFVDDGGRIAVVFGGRHDAVSLEPELNQFHIWTAMSRPVSSCASRFIQLPL